MQNNFSKKFQLPELCRKLPRQSRLPDLFSGLI
jgi:hypothetical protein